MAEILIYGLDTEDTEGEPSLYGVDSRFGSQAYVAGPAARLELVRSFVKDKHPKAVFCLNLQYDLVNLFGETLLDSVIPYCARKKIVGAKMRGAGHVKFYEIARFIPKMNLAELGEAVGVKKLNLPFNDPKRVIRDAKIARMVGERIVAELHKLDMPLKFSPISAAVNALEEDNGAKMAVAPAMARKAGSKALYGGRTEVYYAGKWNLDKNDEVIDEKKRDLYYFDFVSAYGLAMLEDLPDYTDCYESVRPQEKMYISDCTVEVEASLPGVAPLPLHTKDKNLIFPTGEFRGTWTNIDLELPGVKVVKYHKTVNFPVAEPFLAEIVKRILPLKKETKLGKAIKKNIYTGLSGKFSQSSEFTVFIHAENAKPVDYWRGICFGEWMLVDRKGAPPRAANKVWSAFINARNRAWQWRLYESIFTAGGKVLYGDTDSGLGYLKNPILARRICESAQIRTKQTRLYGSSLLSPKIYKLVTDQKDPKTGRLRVILSTKGVPKRLVSESVVLGEETIFGETPDSFFTLLKANQASNALKNKWKKRSWKFSSVNRNRLVDKKTPWTKPLHIRNGRVSIGKSSVLVLDTKEKKRVERRPLAKSPLSDSEWAALAGGVRGHEGT